MIESNTNKLDLAVVICPPWDIRMPSLGLGSLVQFLKSRGITLKVFDMNIDLYNFISDEDKKDWDLTNINDWLDSEKINMKYSKYKEYLEGYIKQILATNPLSICFSVNIANTEYTTLICKRIKELNPKIIIGIGGSNSDEKEIWKKEISKYLDFSVIKEGEYALLESITRIKNKRKDFIGIPGVIDFKKKNKLIPPRVLNLAELPFPKYEEFDLTKYTEKELPMSGSRGCYGKCNFCNDWLQRPYSSKKGEVIFEEITHHIEKYNIYAFRFTDLLINGNVVELEKFCDLVIDSNLNIRWWSTAVINIGMTPRLIKKMKKAGCYYLEFGVENFSPKVLKLMNKPFKYEFIMPILREVKNSGIQVGINILLGFPGETEEDFTEHINNFKKHYEYISNVANLNPVYIYGNNMIETNLKKYNVYDENFNGIHWFTNDFCNTYEVRIERVARMMNVLDQLNIKYPILHNSDVMKDIRKERLKKDIIKRITILEKINPKKLIRNIIYRFPEISKKSVLLDEIQFGKQESELKHLAYGCWGSETDSITSNYGGPDNFRSIGTGSKLFWRDFATWVILTLNIPNKFNKSKINYLTLRLKIHENSYKQGNSGHFTNLKTLRKNEWVELGRFKISGENVWKTYVFKIPKELINSNKIHIKIDDVLNYNLGKYGKRLGWIKLSYEKK